VLLILLSFRKPRAVVPAKWAEGQIQPKRLSDKVFVAEAIAVEQRKRLIDLLDLGILPISISGRDSFYRKFLFDVEWNRQLHRRKASRAFHDHVRFGVAGDQKEVARAYRVQRDRDGVQQVEIFLLFKVRRKVDNDMAARVLDGIIKIEEFRLTHCKALLFKSTSLYGYLGRPGTVG
jgi:hypothetical protein